MSQLRKLEHSEQGNAEQCPTSISRSNCIWWGNRFALNSSGVIPKLIVQLFHYHVPAHLSFCYTKQVKLSNFPSKFRVSTSLIAFSVLIQIIPHMIRSAHCPPGRCSPAIQLPCVCSQMPCFVQPRHTVASLPLNSEGNVGTQQQIVVLYTLFLYGRWQT